MRQLLGSSVSLIENRHRVLEFRGCGARACVARLREPGEIAVGELAEGTTGNAFVKLVFA